MKTFLPRGALLTQEGLEGLEGSVLTFWAGALDLDSGHESGTITHLSFSDEW